MQAGVAAISKLLWRSAKRRGNGGNESQWMCVAWRIIVLLKAAMTVMIFYSMIGEAGVAY